MKPLPHSLSSLICLKSAFTWRDDEILVGEVLELEGDRRYQLVLAVHNAGIVPPGGDVQNLKPGGKINRGSAAHREQRQKNDRRNHRTHRRNCSSNSCETREWLMPTSGISTYRSVCVPSSMRPPGQGARNRARAMIQLLELTKSFGDRVLLDHVTWTVTDRERVGLCGPNGAGKTTLLRLMAGLEEPDSGAIPKPAALTVGYLPQDGLAHAGCTVLEEACSAFGELLASQGTDARARRAAR